jgi:hypothetical protein
MPAKAGILHGRKRGPCFDPDTDSDPDPESFQIRDLALTRDTVTR